MSIFVLIFGQLRYFDGFGTFLANSHCVPANISERSVDADTAGLSCLLWDVDGTLIDTTGIIVAALGRVFREFLGSEVSTADVRAMIGIPLDQQVRSFGAPVVPGARYCDMEAAAIRYYERQRNHEHPITEAVEALIEGKRRGLKTALVTSKNDVELAHTLPRIGISAYCDAIVGADQVAPLYKPHPRPVLMALDLLGVADPAEALFIGDSVHDLRSGKAAGARTAAVLWGAAPAEALRAEQPDMIFEHPRDLLAYARALRPIAVHV